MPNCKSVYDPQEDSTMLEKHVRKFAFGKVLDMGTGSGIQAISAAQSSKVKSVIAADVQKEVIEYCKKNIKHRKIKFLQSDLFENIKGKFDAIIFNPPYLPQELKVRDLALEGGKKGYEVIEEFLSGLSGHLNPEGLALIVFSSFTKKEKVEELVKSILFDFEELERMRIFFEDLHVYRLFKSGLLKTLEAKGIKNVKYLAKGHRGFVYTGILNKKKVVIKAKNPKSTAFNRIANESKWIKVLSRHGIGPNLVFGSEDYFVYNYIDGVPIIEFLKNNEKNEIRDVLKKSLGQCFKMDKLKIDKEEMHHPVKHIIVVKKGKTLAPKMIDFERCRSSENPKNVTQFCQFITSGNVEKILSGKNIAIDKSRIISLAKIYKRSISIQNLNNILKAI
ncbi:MAG TPA: HemK2/MTQ2 family protein methyltransferase [Candidatus Nanoarchaeia archaeon]|nr:HemK2/MTQ2 family protein methyltransferase [Candidatus Nanoarchaeia archaeon]